MEKYYGIAHRSDYTYYDICDLVYPVNIRHWHRNETWETPEEDDIDFDLCVDKEFDSVVSIFSVEFLNEEDEKGQYLEINGMKYLLMVPWYEALERHGYTTFDAPLDELFKSEDEARRKLYEWQDSYAYEQALNYEDNGDY